MKQGVDPDNLNLSLPPSQRAFVEAAAARSGTTSGEYVWRLICDAQRRAAQEELERLALEGLRSGDSIEVTPAFWEERRRELQERIERNKS